MVVNNPALLPASKCPDGRGIGVRISVESVSGCCWNGCPNGHGIRMLIFNPALVTMQFMVRFEDPDRCLASREAQLQLPAPAR